MPGGSCTLTSVPAEVPLWLRAQKQGKMGGNREGGREISESNRSSVRESPLKL